MMCSIVLDHQYIENSEEIRRINVHTDDPEAAQTPDLMS